MKTIESSQTIDVYPGVDVQVQSRKVTVKGPRGTLVKHFKHLDVEIKKEKNTIKVGVWFGKRKHLACIRTVCTHIENLMKGVTKGFQYKMRTVYNHFPINLNISDDKRTIEIRNFLGDKFTRKITMLNGVTVDVTTNKDEIVLEGNDLENVSQSCANISQSVTVKDKDIRKFLDGIYVSEKAFIVKDE